MYWAYLNLNDNDRDFFNQIINPSESNSITSVKPQKPADIKGLNCVIKLYFALQPEQAIEFERIIDSIDKPSIKSQVQEISTEPSIVFVPRSQYNTVECSIPLKGRQSKVVQIPSEVPKIERENAWAMTSGFQKDGDLYYVSIFTAAENALFLRNNFDARGRFIPRILVCTRSRDEQYPISKLGSLMGVSDYSQPFRLNPRYVAILDRIFYIKKEFHDFKGMDLWQELCNNGIFDIWDPVAPFHRLTGNFDLQKTGKKTVRRPQILLLRIFELDHPLVVKHRKTRTDLVIGGGNGTPLNLKRPIIPYNTNDRFYHGFKGKYTFSDIYNLIKNILLKFGQLDEEIINDTSQIDIPI